MPDQADVYLDRPGDPWSQAGAQCTCSRMHEPATCSVLAAHPAAHPAAGPAAAAAGLMEVRHTHSSGPAGSVGSRARWPGIPPTGVPARALDRTGSGEQVCHCPRPDWLRAPPTTSLGRPCHG